MRSVYEIKAEKELQTDGYNVDYKVRPFRPRKGFHVDFFNLFDLMAYKPGELRLISIKGQAGVPRKHRAAIADFKPPVGVQKEVWHYIIDVEDKRRTRCIKNVIP